MSVNYGTGRNITLSGTLTSSGMGPTPPTQTVNITGKATGTATVDGSGNYSITLTASGLGDVMGQSGDGLSNIVTITLTDTAPVITSFSAVQSLGNQWTFSGHVNYRSPESLVINLGGDPVSVQGVTAAVNTNGDFSVTVHMSGQPSDNGFVTAVTTDPWGLVSNTMSTYILQS
jgi:hypothetical protein